MITPTAASSLSAEAATPLLRWALGMAVVKAEGNLQVFKIVLPHVMLSACLSLRVFDKL